MDVGGEAGGEGGEDTGGDALETAANAATGAEEPLGQTARKQRGGGVDREPDGDEDPAG